MRSSSFRLVTWNCRSGAVNARLTDLAAFAPDIVFLQECAPAETLPFSGHVLTRRVNAKKGLALASLSSDYEIAEVRTEGTRTLPSIFATVTGPDARDGDRVSFSVLGLWPHGS